MKNSLRISGGNLRGKKIPFEFKSRRLGDVAVSYASPDNAKKELNWTAKRNLKDICLSGWKHRLISNKLL